MALVMILVTTFAMGAGSALDASPQAVAPARAATVTIVGTVVDAACYMMHPAAATGVSHEECGTACIARGVPVAIASETDKTLYFLADGQALKGMLHQRVRATGTVTEKREPMELTMPVGDSNEMVVRVDGGYKVIAIETVSSAPPLK